ncbi:MAG TPA: DUF2784 domain-containing protein [Gammaproteobacteria bacterium]|jgi:hypothetical protein|nr:DUF2784 domain-containing protein [Gammaproteobacteria bacterium]
MAYRVLADLVVLLHFAFVAFVVLGGLLVLCWPRVAWLHLPAAAWGAFVELYLHYCPLTPLENWLRERGGLDTYGRGFIDHYIVPVIYPPGLTPGLQFLLGIALVVSYLAIYAVAWRRYRAGAGSYK